MLASSAAAKSYLREPWSSKPRCTRCGAVGASKRCVKCRSCFYCSKECQSKDWKIHRRVCSEDPSLRPYVPIEAAIEGVLARLPSQATPPKDARCYICLEQGGLAPQKGGLTRGCACRGDAGYVHAACLEELGKRTGNWKTCVTCKKDHTGALELELQRRFWRAQRSGLLRGQCLGTLGAALEVHGALEAADWLFAERAKEHGGADVRELMAQKLRTVKRLRVGDRRVDALRVLDDELLPLVAEHNYGDISKFGVQLELQLERLEISLELDRFDENNATLAEGYLRYARHTFTLESPLTQRSLVLYGIAAGMTGHFDASKNAFDELFAHLDRVYGRHHVRTRGAYFHRAILSYKMIVKASNLLTAAEEEENSEQKTTNPFLRPDDHNEDNDDTENLRKRETDTPTTTTTTKALSRRRRRETRRRRDEAASFLDAVLAHLSDFDLLDEGINENVDMNFRTMLGVLSVMNGLGRTAEAAKLGAVCVDFGKRRFGPEDAKTLESIDMYGIACIHSPDRRSDGIRVISELLAITTKHHGPHSKKATDIARLLSVATTQREKNDNAFLPENNGEDENGALVCSSFES